MVALDETICGMVVAGVSLQGVGAVMEALTGNKPSPATVSRVVHSPEAEFAAWNTRPVNAHDRYRYADGTSFTVMDNGEGCTMPMLTIVGIDDHGQREGLALGVGERENQQA